MKLLNKILKFFGINLWAYSWVEYEGSDKDEITKGNLYTFRIRKSRIDGKSQKKLMGINHFPYMPSKPWERKWVNL